MQSAQAYTMEAAQQSPTLETGRILAGGSGVYSVQTEDSRWQASAAASCLVRPECGDEVLFTPLPDGRAFILAVLTRSETACVLDFPHGASLASAKQLNLDSAEALNLHAPDTSLETAHLAVRSGEVAATVNKATLVTRFLKSCGECLEQTFNHLLGRYESSKRLVEHTDELQAENVRISASDSCMTQAASSTTLARDLVRIDASQVHIS